MPIFDYKCPACGATREGLAPSLEDALLQLPCTRCDAWMDRAQFSVPATPQFKGTGWYETDYKDKK